VGLKSVQLDMSVVYCQSVKIRNPPCELADRVIAPKLKLPGREVRGKRARCMVNILFVENVNSGVVWVVR
jgi:hypothetical protein